MGSVFYVSDTMRGVNIFYFSLLLAVVTAKSYSKHKVLRVEVKDETDAKAISELENKYDFWTQIRIGHHVDIMASPDNLEDLQPLVELEKKASVKAKTKLWAGHNMDWTSYHALEDIYGWFDYLETTYDFCEKENIGQTFEGQDMIVMKVCKGGCGNKPAMWIDSGIHAREWIAPAVGTWMLNELVEKSADHPELLDNLDWYFLPSHNPDGYRKSRDDDRFWRKTTTQYDGDACQ